MVDRLTFEHGRIKLGGDLLPGVFKDLWVQGSVQLDEFQVDGLSGKVRRPMGWKNSDVSLTLELLTDDQSSCYKKLAVINRIYKSHGGNADPKVFDVSANPHFASRGIDQVIFAGLDSWESDQDDVIGCGLQFVEDNPVVVNSEQRTVASDKATGDMPAVSPSNSVSLDDDVGTDDTNPLGEGYRSGAS